MHRALFLHVQLLELEIEAAGGTGVGDDLEFRTDAFA